MRKDRHRNTERTTRTHNEVLTARRHGKKEEAENVQADDNMRDGFAIDSPEDTRNGKAFGNNCQTVQIMPTH